VRDSYWRAMCGKCNLKVVSRETNVQRGAPDRALRVRVSHDANTRHTQQQDAKKLSALRRTGSCVRSESPSTAMSAPASEGSGRALAC
jgi:hypothetical protein